MANDPTAASPMRPADGAASAVPDRRRPGRQRPRRGYRLLALLGVLVVGVLLAPAPLVDPLVERAAYGYQSACTRFSGVEVDSGDWPVVARAAVGRMRAVSARADTVTFDSGVTIHDVVLSADAVDVAPMRFGLGDGDADIRGGEASATVRYGEIEHAIADLGVTVHLRGGDDDSLVADVEVPVIGTIPTRVELVPVDGDLELRFAALDVIPLPSLLIVLPEPVALADIDVGDDGVRIATTVDGTLTADDWGCDADATEAPG
jgi:hypothetical protein